MGGSKPRLQSLGTTQGEDGSHAMSTDSSGKPPFAPKLPIPSSRFLNKLSRHFRYHRTESGGFQEEMVDVNLNKHNVPATSPSPSLLPSPPPQTSTVSYFDAAGISMEYDIKGTSLSPESRLNRPAISTPENRPRCALSSVQENSAKDNSTYGQELPSSYGRSYTMNRSTEDASLTNDDLDDESFRTRYGDAPKYCSSKDDICIPRTSWITITTFALSVFSTVMSGIWFSVAIIQPHWGRRISVKHGLEPSTATLLAALGAKLIELSFVTIFVLCMGQILTRKAIIKKARGMTLAEMTMRNWIIQPGSLVTNFQSFSYASPTFMGAVCLAATLASLFYTTASDAMVSPKLMEARENRELSGHVRSSFANPRYAQGNCPTMTRNDPLFGNESCFNIKSAAQSYTNLIALESAWHDISNQTQQRDRLSNRPAGSRFLFNNVTIIPTWIETEHGNVTAQFEKTGRIINNVTLAVPHPNVYTAVMDPVNGIIQPDELDGVGEYTVRASVVSPTLNVLCVNMNKEELKPIVYEEWPHAIKDKAEAIRQWQEHVPQPFDKQHKENWLNRTVVDDIFRWGEKYRRRPPVFQVLPPDYNLVTNMSTMVPEADSLYIMGKAPYLDDYTLCQLRSWVSPKCSTRLNMATGGAASLEAHCEDPEDPDAYLRSFDKPPTVHTSSDWKWLADLWRLSMDLNGGVYQNNASNARILTQTALDLPYLPASHASMAESFAAMASGLLVIGAADTPFRHDWEYKDAEFNILPAPGPRASFNATLTMPQYRSSHIYAWQSIFYVVLSLVFVINLLCLVYLILRPRLVTDFTEPQNMFALAINSPPNVQIQGSCRAGPQKRDFTVPWRVAYAPSANHYFFMESNEHPWRGRYSKQGVSTVVEIEGNKGSSYRRLRAERA